MATDPDKACLHLKIQATVNVGRLFQSDDHDGPPDSYVAEIVVECADCKEPFRWIGVPAGYSPRQPMVSVDEKTLRAPLRPASSDPDFGLSGVPGFAIRMAES